MCLEEFLKVMKEIISKGAEESFNKTQHPFMIKI